MTDTDERMIREIARLCSLPESRVERTVTLLQGGATIPFIARYRKEATGATKCRWERSATGSNV